MGSDLRSKAQLKVHGYAWHNFSIIMDYHVLSSSPFNIFRLAEVVQGAEASVEA